MYEGTEAKPVAMQGPVLEGSKSVPPRYVTEDVPEGLVAWSSLGSKIGVATPTVDTLIHLATIVKGTDYRRQGRTVERLGLADKSLDEALALVNGR
jgi:opine dehydrogenase